MVEIKIKEPYWSAWKTYHWDKFVWGVGLNKNSVDYALENKEVVRVSAYKKKFLIMPEDILNQVNKYKSQTTARGTKLYVIPYTSMTEIK
jgi:hypothetical protein